MGKNNDIANQILDAVEVIADKKIAAAGFDRTIQAIVLECTDTEKGIYKLQYQDSRIYAEAPSPNDVYERGTSVYVLVPQGDMSKKKKILSEATSIRDNNNNVVYDDSQRFDTWYTNLIDVKGYEDFKDNIFSLQSRGTVKNIAFGEDSAYALKLNPYADSYISKCTHLLLGFNLQTALSSTKGNYGARLTIEFISGDTRTPVEYVLDAKDVVGIGAPWHIQTWFAQKKYFQFELPEDTNYKITKLELFAEDFEAWNGDANEALFDISFTDIGLYACRQLTTQELESPRLVITYPQGTTIESKDKPISLIAKIKKQGKELAVSAQYNWFEQDARVSNSSVSGYMSGAGFGWRMINGATSSTLEISAKDVLTKDKVYKCIATIKDEGMTLSDTETIHNLVAEYDISAAPDKELYSYYGDKAKITAAVIYNDKDISENNGLTYYWFTKKNEIEYHSYNPTNNNFINFDITTAKIEAYVSVYQGEKFIGSTSTAARKSMEKEAVQYQPSIVNGDQIFMYDENGISPCHEKVNPRQQVKELYVSITDNAKNVTYTSEDEKQTQLHNITWYVPYDNSMIRTLNSVVSANEIVHLDSGYNEYVSDETQNRYIVYTGSGCSFSIKDNYDITKTHNTIIAKFEYDNQTFKTATNLVITSQGEIGTNGTARFSRIIVEEDKNILEKNGIYTFFKGNFNSDVTNLFKYELVEGEDVIYPNVEDNSHTKDGRECELTWSIVSEKKGNDFKVGSHISINNGINLSPLDSNAPTQLANDVLKAELTLTYPVAKDEETKDEIHIADGTRPIVQTYYATLPIGQKVVLEEDQANLIDIDGEKGYTYVRYGADGTNPKIGGFTKEFEFVTKAKDKFLCHWQIVGDQQVLTTKVGSKRAVASVADSNNLKLRDIPKYSENNKTALGNLLPLQVKVEPSETYDGSCTNNAIICTIYSAKENDFKKQIGTEEELNTALTSLTKVAIYRIPIHFYYNRYGHAAINAWDGNSIEVNNKDGVLMAPQVGAGKKESDNSFTGLVMGTYKPGKVAVDSKEYNTPKTGLFGFNHSEQTIELNAEDGSAFFGKQGKGQIIIDPNSSDGGALLRSGNFSISNKTGMQIDLSTPNIQYGSGNFTVNENGTLSAKGADIDGNFYAHGKYNNGEYKVKFGQFKDGEATDFLIRYQGTSEYDNVEKKIELNTSRFYLGETNEEGSNYLHYTFGGGLDIRGSFKCIAEEGKSGIDKEWKRSQVIFSPDEISLQFQAENTDENNGYKQYSRIDQDGFLLQKTARYNGEVWLDSSLRYDAQDGLSVVGNISATTGTIGGWTIGPDSLMANTKQLILYADGQIVSKMTSASGSSAPSSISSYNGNTTAKSALFDGGVYLYSAQETKESSADKVTEKKEDKAKSNEAANKRKQEVYTSKRNAFISKYEHDFGKQPTETEIQESIGMPPSKMPESGESLDTAYDSSDATNLSGYWVAGGKNYNWEETGVFTATNDVTPYGDVTVKGKQNNGFLVEVQNDSNKQDAAMRIRNGDEASMTAEEMTDYIQGKAPATSKSKVLHLLANKELEEKWLGSYKTGGKDDSGADTTNSHRYNALTMLVPKSITFSSYIWNSTDAIPDGYEYEITQETYDKITDNDIKKKYSPKPSEQAYWEGTTITAQGIATPNIYLASIRKSDKDEVKEQTNLLHTDAQDIVGAINELHDGGAGGGTWPEKITYTAGDTSKLETVKLSETVSFSDIAKDRIKETYPEKTAGAGQTFKYYEIGVQKPGTTSESVKYIASMNEVEKDNQKTFEMDKVIILEGF